MRKNILKRVLTLGVAATMVMSMFAGCGQKENVEKNVEKNVEENVEKNVEETVEEGTYKAGTYEVKTVGMHDMTVKVTVSKDTITDIKVEHQETAGVGAPVAESMPKDIIEIQGLGIDAVAGATITSNAILSAVEDALRQAGASDAKIAELKTVKKQVVKAENETKTADVVVIGAGGAGMAAAVTANQAGKSVIVIEKTSMMGGNTILSGGAMNAVQDGSDVAKEKEDSVAWHYEQTYKGGDYKGNPALIKVLTDNAWSGVEWLKSLGMEFTGKVFTVTGGLWPRAQQPKEPEGTGFFKTYQSYVDKHSNLEIVYNTEAKELIVKDGVVVGVKCVGQTGNEVIVNANNGVVLATGGFGWNVEMRQEANKVLNMWPTLDETIPSTNTSSITGDGITMAKAIGANTVGMEYIQLLPLGDPKTGSLRGNIEHAVESRIFVNLDGKRYGNEAGRRDEMTLDLFAQRETTMFIIMDSDTYPTGNEKNNFGETMNDLVAQGRAYKADALEDLAKQIGVPAENLVATVKEYNRYCIGGDKFGEKDEFGRALFADSEGENNGINNAPYYAAKRVPTVHHTMGGVEIDTETHVIDTNGNIIKGLFAAGEVTGGIHGSNRLGGNALTDTVVFGRIAGQNAAAFTR